MGRVFNGSEDPRCCFRIDTPNARLPVTSAGTAGRLASEAVMGIRAAIIRTNARGLHQSVDACRVQKKSTDRTHRAMCRGGRSDGSGRSPRALGDVDVVAGNKEGIAALKKDSRL